MDILTASASPSFILVFLAGILSFFSPCIIPVLPLYMGYLAGGTQHTDAEGKVTYDRKTVMLHTAFFVIGISAAFFLLGTAFTALGDLLSQWQTWIVRVGAIIIIVLGIFMFIDADKGVGKEHRLTMPTFAKMGPLAALALGFIFSFAWTPCVGPILSSVLIMVSGASTKALGYVMIAVYTLGFIVPFLLLGLFTTQVLDWLKAKKNVLRYTTRAAAIILVILGISMLTGWLNTATSQLSRFTGGESILPSTQQEQATNPDQRQGETAPPSEQLPEKERTPAPDFTLTDQNGVEHKLSDYQGKTVFINFWATWCPPCKGEMPDIEKLYAAHGYNQEDVIVLGIANPRSTANPTAGDVTVEEVSAFLDENGYTFPTLMDSSGEAYQEYYVTVLPTTFIIRPDGTIEGYLSGSMAYNTMEHVIAQAQTN